MMMPRLNAWLWRYRAPLIVADLVAIGIVLALTITR